LKTSPEPGPPGTKRGGPILKKPTCWSFISSTVLRVRLGAPWD